MTRRSARFASALLVCIGLSAWLLGCSSSDSDSDDRSQGLCYGILGTHISVSCSGFNENGRCDDSDTPTWYGKYSDPTLCRAAAEKMGNDWKNGIKPTPGGGGSTSGGGSSGADCVKSCPSEVSDVQLDSFCRQACCLTITGQTSRAATTCKAGSSLGTSRCKYCR